MCFSLNRKRVPLNLDSSFTYCSHYREGMFSGVPLSNVQWVVMAIVCMILNLFDILSFICLFMLVPLILFRVCVSAALAYLHACIAYHRMSCMMGDVHSEDAVLKSSSSDQSSSRAMSRRCIHLTVVQNRCSGFPPFKVSQDVSAAVEDHDLR